MERMSIVGIGCISNLGNDMDTIWENLMKENEISTSHGVISFDSGLSLSQRKKCNRYSEMGIYVSNMAIKDSQIDINSMDKNRTGTIFTTGYGPMISTLKFSQSVIEGDYEFCSPTVFANSVHNACVGHICMAGGLKGVSTGLMGSNNLEYSQMLLNKGDTDYILSGAIEEYCKELHDALGINETSKNIFITEGAVAFLLKNVDNASDTYCNIIDFSECNINKYPVTDIINDDKVSEKIRRIMEKLINKYDIDAFFSSCNGSYFDNIELNAAQQVLKKDVVYINNVKEFFGETLGTAFNMNVMVAAFCLKNGKLPLKLNSSQRRIKSALVSGYDISGNYMLTVLEKIT